MCFSQDLPFGGVKMSGYGRFGAHTPVLRSAAPVLTAPARRPRGPARADEHEGRRRRPLAVAHPDEHPRAARLPHPLRRRQLVRPPSMRVLLMRVLMWVGAPGNS